GGNAPEADRERARVAALVRHHHDRRAVLRPVARLDREAGARIAGGERGVDREGDVRRPGGEADAGDAAVARPAVGPRAVDDDTTAFGHGRAGADRDDAVTRAEQAEDKIVD